VAAAAILLHPAVIDVSAWWGQYESIFVLFGLGAAVAASHGRNALAAVLVGAALATKPQAIPFVLPFAAWFWATGYGRDGIRGGVLELARTGVVGLATLTVLWLPFLGHGGPSAYLANIASYQGDDFAILSLRAWNGWWLVQEAAAGGGFVADDVAIIGPITLRHLGYLVTAGLSLLVAAAIVRDPRPRTLVLGLATSVLVAFTFLTQMHERYAFAALAFLVLLVPERGPRWLFVAFSVVFTLNLLAAVPPTEAIGAALPVSGVLGVAGSIAMVGLTVWAYWLLRRPAPTD
jgi:Gpi18-like mannosyltransferase